MDKQQMDKQQMDSQQQYAGSLLIDSGAMFSECGKYRHSLWRIWDTSKPLLTMIMLNPSTAGETENDPTVARQIVRADMLGCGGLLVGNIFDFRATDPEVMKAEAVPSSCINDWHLFQMAMRAVSSGGMIICAWGKDGAHMERGREVCGPLKTFPLHALRINKDGTPGHPLYIGYQVLPKLWRSN